ncbi:putative O-methyltransferase YrrM [Bradyrhizobium sp. LM4.3]
MKQRGPGGGRSSSGKPSAGEGTGLRSEPAPITPKLDKASANDQSLDSIVAADKIAALKLAPVSHETEARLDRYIALLREWQAKTNLVAPSTLPHLWTRHIADSLQLVALAPSAKRWADLGSGGGFPGVVLACAMAGTAEASVHLVERTAKKAAFLRESYSRHDISGSRTSRRDRG